MKKLAYITNTSLSNASGGGSGVNHAAHSQLKKAFNIIEVPVIVTDADFFAKLKSTVLKQFGLKRNYHYFSPGRLNSVAKKFNKLMSTTKDVDVYFFHSFTQWLKVKPNKPYYCYNDACFATYVRYYNNVNEFSKKDLNRIFDLEKQWLTNARHVFFRSQWALEQTRLEYQTSGKNFINVGVGGFIDIPKRDYYSSSYKFLFISREFVPKGGVVALNAFRMLKQQYPSIEINVIGDAPPEDMINEKGVNYIGFINKKIKSEKNKLIDIFKSSFVLLHPTKKDINPLVLLELAYYGCPAISSNSFAIPEYVLDGQTGFLLQDETDPKELAKKMEYLITHKNEYMNMRDKARRNATENNTWDAVGQRITNVIKGN